MLAVEKGLQFGLPLPMFSSQPGAGCKARRQTKQQHGMETNCQWVFAGCFPCQSPAPSREYFCVRTDTEQPWEELCKAPGTCDYRLKALINPFHGFTHTGFGCSYSCIDFLFLLYFKSHFLEAQAKNNTLFTQILASAKWEATAELAAKCFNLDP